VEDGEFVTPAKIIKNVLKTLDSPLK
jgi:hypothetical protein